jgi:hypothetical protein
MTRIFELGTTLKLAHAITSQKTAFFIVTVVKTSNLAKLYIALQFLPLMGLTRHSTNSPSMLVGIIIPYGARGAVIG